MTKKVKKQMLKSIMAELKWLDYCSKRQHGEEFVRFSPTYRDFESKRRVRLARTYWALQNIL